MIDKLDNLVSLNVNTVFFHVKPDGTALYRSILLPWSDVLTGVVGKDPGYDPLAFMLAEGHKRELCIHAWLNPYRVTSNT
ncbi:MAG: family 10 glycosylhydrolase [Symbiopectobacterium sp.]